MGWVVFEVRVYSLAHLRGHSAEEVAKVFATILAPEVHYPSHHELG